MGNVLIVEHPESEKDVSSVRSKGAEAYIGGSESVEE